MRGFFAIPLLCSILISFTASAGDKIQGGTISSDIENAADPRFRAGDDAFRARADEKQAREAFRLYRGYSKSNPADAAAHWRLAMSCYYVGVRLTPDEDERKAIYEEGRDAGFDGVKLDEKCAACHFWGAINLALYGEAVGALKMLFALGDLREHLQAVVALDARYAYGGAYRILGLIDERLPGIFGGDNDRAKDYFQKAINVGPEEPLNYLFMARLLRDDFDDPKDAAVSVKRGLEVPKPGSDRIESLEALDALKTFKVEK